MNRESIKIIILIKSRITLYRKDAASNPLKTSQNTDPFYSKRCLKTIHYFLN